MKLILRDVRSFHGHHEVELTPLTFLVGENSSGKTTFLAALSAVLRRDPFPYAPGLADPPYDITSFYSIASDHGGAAGRAEEFSLGYSQQDQKLPAAFVATYGDNFGQPTLRRIQSDVGDDRVTIEFVAKQARVSIATKGASEESITVPMPELQDSSTHTRFLSPGFLYRIFDSARRMKGSSRLATILERQLFFPFARFAGSESESISIAPIRTKPLPAYPQATDQYEPEGDHIPLLLARAFDKQATSQEQHNVLTSGLASFGEESGLFKEIRVKRLGTKPSDPFQLLVKVATQTSNISDVGYGVSQALPVAVQSITARRGQYLLIQQPEVHLHPKAQAAMGTLFVELKKRDRKQFVVETHSDYLIDRVRRHVSAGELKAEDVTILFFNRDGRETHIHPIHLDRNGNIVGAPPEYRSFFIEEQMGLIAGDTDVPNS